MKTLEILERLVGFETESSLSNLALIDFVSDYLARHGAEVSRHPNAAGDKAAILATLGPKVDGGIVLSGRLEVTVGDERRILGPGDAYAFDSRRPHRFRCIGPVPCEVVSACTPPSF